MESEGSILERRRTRAAMRCLLRHLPELVLQFPGQSLALHTTLPGRTHASVCRILNVAHYILFVVVDDDDDGDDDGVASELDPFYGTPAQGLPIRNYDLDYTGVCTLLPLPWPSPLWVLCSVGPPQQFLRKALLPRAAPCMLAFAATASPCYM